MQRYKRRSLKGIKQLNQEQERISRACRQMEQDWVQTIFNPQALAFNALSGLLKRRAGGQKQNKSDSGNPLFNSASKVLQNKTLQRLALLTGKSWLRWQAFNLALFIGTKGYQAIRERMRKQKASREASPPALTRTKSRFVSRLFKTKKSF